MWPTSLVIVLLSHSLHIIAISLGIQSIMLFTCTYCRAKHTPMYTYTSVDFKSVQICTDSLYIEDKTQITPGRTL